MKSNASIFIKGRNNKTAVIDSRIRNILNYVIGGYNKTISDGKQYDYSKRGKISQENFLRNGLVDDYLRKHIHLLNTGTENYTIITKEATETYLNVNDNQLHDDPIDIQITDAALQKAWNSENHVYYAIECKRIQQLSDTTKYIDDVRKFTERKYQSTRLPFEGQLAFIEASAITHKIASDDINSKLSTHTSISTIDALKAIKIDSTFDGSYVSKHKKNFGKNDSFAIYHLLLDYSKIVIQ